MKQKTHGCEQFQTEFAQLEADGKPARLIMARRMLRLLRALNRDATIYRPPHLRTAQRAPKPKPETHPSAAPDPDADQEISATERLYYHELLEKIIPKWTIGPDWPENFSDQTQWGILLRTLDSLHALGLGIPQAKGTQREAKSTAKQSMPNKTTKQDRRGQAVHRAKRAKRAPDRCQQSNHMPPKIFQPDDPDQGPHDHGDRRSKSKPKRTL